MNQTKSTLHAGGALTAGAALAALVLFAIRVQMPGLYGEMGDMEIEAVRLLVMLGATRLYSMFGPKGGMPTKEPAEPAEEQS